MNQRKFEFFVGLFMALGILSLAYLSIRIARNDLFTDRGYDIQAVFANCNGLRAGSSIMIAGVEIGRVKQIALQDYEAKITFQIQHGVALQKDAIASIKTKGLIGEKYIEITPGAAEQNIPEGGRLLSTEPAMDIEGLISKFVQGNLSTKPAN
ncbi:MAG: outer membrane lipid asymmetry maintenance protein MlaD [Chthoniobacteraceae bacterium]|nr:outer membrane lipid asymmetry maintenance protein MlaD [Chthoniobacteraceae bacterium]